MGAFVLVAGSISPCTGHFKSAAPQPASVLLKAAEARSAATGKPILVIFGASWCGYCHLLENYLSLPSVKPIFDRNYIVLRMDVCEQGARVKLENPGATELAYEWSGQNPSLPYSAVLNAKGYIIADQMGYPVGPDQLPHFRQLLVATAPRMSEKDLDAICNSLPRYLEQQEEIIIARQRAAH